MLSNLVPRHKRKQVKLIVKTGGADGKRVFRRRREPFVEEPTADLKFNSMEPDEPYEPELPPSFDIPGFGWGPRSKKDKGEETS